MVKTLTNDKMTANYVELREKMVGKKVYIQYPQMQVDNDSHMKLLHNMGNRNNKIKILSNTSAAPVTGIPNHTPHTGGFLCSSLLPQQQTLQLYVRRFLTRRDACGS